MNVLTVILLAVVLGIDAFSVCLGVGLAGISRRRGVLLIFTVAVFHVFMPLTGWWIGGAVGVFLGQLAGVVGATVLFVLGARMVLVALKDSNLRDRRMLSPGVLGIATLAASVSMDALSIGFTLGVYYHYKPLLLAGIVGLVAGLMTALGLSLGRVIGSLIGQRAQLVGGLILFGVGVSLLR